MDKETHIANLISLAKMDGVLHAHELIFIQGLALRMGVDGQGFQRIVKYPELVPQRLPENEKDRLQQLSELIVLLHIDFNADSEELRFVQKVGEKFGYTATQVDALVKYLQHNTLPTDQDELRDVMNK